MDFSIKTLLTPLTLASSDKMQSVPLQIIEDAVSEGNEIFILSLSLVSASNGIQIGQKNTSITIKDNDSKQLELMDTM